MRRDTKSVNGKTWADFLRDDEKGLLWCYESEIHRLMQEAARIRNRATGRRKYAGRKTMRTASSALTNGERQ